MNLFYFRYFDDYVIVLYVLCVVYEIFWNGVLGYGIGILYLGYGIGI